MQIAEVFRKRLFVSDFPARLCRRHKCQRNMSIPFPPLLEVRASESLLTNLLMSKSNVPHVLTKYVDAVRVFSATACPANFFYSTNLEEAEEVRREKIIQKQDDKKLLTTPKGTSNT